MSLFSPVDALFEHWSGNFVTNFVEELVTFINFVNVNVGLIF